MHVQRKSIYVAIGTYLARNLSVGETLGEIDQDSVSIMPSRTQVLLNFLSYIIDTYIHLYKAPKAVPGITQLDYSPNVCHNHCI